jgi:adenosylcobinamide kinase/adenosylcobinamide-phosphate guanylyltransferase
LCQISVVSSERSHKNNRSLEGAGALVPWWCLRYRRRVSDRSLLGRLFVVGGGARSGKSRFALDLALSLGEKRVFIATAEPLDQEMTDRISRHKAERGTAFHTIEEPVLLPETLDHVYAGAGRQADATPTEVVLVDCLTLWVSNHLVRGTALGEIRAGFDRLETALGRRRGHVILVTNEVGMGLVPETPLGRAFRDAIGELHQRLARRADEIYAAVMGTVLRLSPGPVQMVSPGGAGTPNQGT